MTSLGRRLHRRANDPMYVARRRYDPRMGYKLLGFIVWQGIRLYLRNSGKGNVVKAGLAYDW